MFPIPSAIPAAAIAVAVAAAAAAAATAAAAAAVAAGAVAAVAVANVAVAAVPAAVRRDVFGGCHFEAMWKRRPQLPQDSGMPLVRQGEWVF